MKSLVKPSYNPKAPPDLGISNDIVFDRDTERLPSISVPPTTPVLAKLPVIRQHHRRKFLVRSEVPRRLPMSQLNPPDL